MGIASLFTFGVVNLLNGDLLSSFVEIAMGIVLVFNLILLRISKNQSLAGALLMFTIGVTLLILLFTGGIDNTGIFWFFAFPVGAFHVLGKRNGALAVVYLLLLILFLGVIQHQGIIGLAYSTTTIRQLLASLLVVASLVYVYVHIDEESNRIVRELDQTKSQFIMLASHQLRSPLSSCRWFIEMLLAGDAGKLNPEQTEMAQNIDDSINRSIRLVGSLLAVSQIESGRFATNLQPTNLGNSIDLILKEFATRINDSSLKITKEIDYNLRTSVDPELMDNVFRNLLSNSVRYTPANGEIFLKLFRQDGVVVFQIKDTGSGIPKNEQKRVFQKFFRGSNVLKYETDGNGLGLFLVKSIVESLNGNIWFESEENKGTTFWVSLPLASST